MVGTRQTKLNPEKLVGTRKTKLSMKYWLGHVKLNHEVVVGTPETKLQLSTSCLNWNIFSHISISHSKSVKNSVKDFIS